MEFKAAVRERIEVVEGEAAERAPALVLLLRVKGIRAAIELGALLCGTTRERLGRTTRQSTSRTGREEEEEP